MVFVASPVMSLISVVVSHLRIEATGGQKQMQSGIFTCFRDKMSTLSGLTRRDKLVKKQMKKQK